MTVHPGPGGPIARRFRIFGALNIAFGALGVLIHLQELALWLVATAEPRDARGGLGPVADVIWGWGPTWALIGLAASGVLVYSGVLLRRGDDRGRRLSLRYAVEYGLLLSAVNAAISFAFACAPNLAAYERTGQPESMARAISTWIFVALNVGPAVFYAILLLGFLPRGEVVAATAPDHDRPAS